MPAKVEFDPKKERAFTISVSLFLKTVWQWRGYGKGTFNKGNQGVGRFLGGDFQPPEPVPQVEIYARKDSTCDKRTFD